MQSQGWSAVVNCYCTSKTCIEKIRPCAWHCWPRSKAICSYFKHNIFNTNYNEEFKKNPKIKPTLTSTIHCCRFPRLFRKPVRSSWCLPVVCQSTRAQKINSYQVWGYDGFFQGSSEKIHVVWYEYLSRNISFVTKLYNA